MLPLTVCVAGVAAHSRHEQLHFVELSRLRANRYRAQTARLQVYQKKPIFPTHQLRFTMAKKSPTVA